MYIMADIDLTSGLSAFDFSVVVEKLYFFAGIFLFLFIIGAIVFGMIYIKRKNTNKEGQNTIGWFEEVVGGMKPIRSDIAEEVVIPGTTLRVFYVKKKDLWLPRFTRGIDKNLFYVLLTPTKQMVNFTLKTLSGDLKEAGLEYDHTDMLWAAENTREFIKRNYKDKSVKWWQAYQGAITTAIYILIITFSLIMIIFFLRGVVQDIGGVASTLSSVLESQCVRAATSGIVAG